MKYLATWAMAAMACVSLGRQAGAQAPPRAEDVFERRLFYEKEIRDRIEASPAPKQKAFLQYGGLYIPSYLQAADLENDRLHMTRQDLRLWGQLDIDEVHRVFARLKMNYTDFASGDAEGLRAHDLDGPDVDVAYYELDVAGAAKKYCGQDWPIGLKARGGRQFVDVGRGIALADTLDVGSFDFETKDLFLTGFAGRTPIGRENIDPSAPQFPHSRRTFYGMEMRYRGLPKHEPYYFMVLQRDWSDESPDNPNQDFRYSSNYHGVGSRGEVIPDLRYAIESLWEFGHSAPNAVEGVTDRIEGYAFDSQLDYYPRLPLKPVASVEYAYASGDGDRQSATTAILGNRHHTPDDAFQGFGYVNSGLALGARFTNLQFVRLGGRITPYDKKEALGRIDVGFNHYFQFKTDRRGPISDFRANEASDTIGQEIDLFLEWRILSDLALTVHYGRFFPGGAYEDQHRRNFLFTALTFSF